MDQLASLLLVVVLVLYAGMGPLAEGLLEAAQDLSGQARADAQLLGSIPSADWLSRCDRELLGARADGVVEIRDGLQGDERVVVQGAGFLTDGDRVRVAPAGADAG